MLKLNFILLLTTVAIANGQSCIQYKYSGNTVFSFQMKNYVPGICLEFALDDSGQTRNFRTTFEEVTSVDCNSLDLILLDENRAQKYSFCQSSLTGAFFQGKTVYARIVTKGYGSFSIKLNFLTSTNTQIPSRQNSSSTTTVTTRNPTGSTPTRPAVTPSVTSNSSLFPDYSSCGLPKIKPLDSEMRIIGGQEVIPNSWPWQVFVYDGSHMCGGSLINNQWVLTAAHCVSDYDIRIFHSSHDLDNLNSANSVKIVKKIKYQQYDEEAIVNDIALLKLEKPVTFNDKVSPVCLPKKLNAVDGRVAIVTGWGRTSGQSNPSDILRQVALPVHSTSQCTMFGNLDSKSQICAGSTERGILKSSCQGDSGGPLVTKEGNNFVIGGVVSFGLAGCPTYSIFTNVYNYMPWIENTVRNN